MNKYQRQGYLNLKFKDDKNLQLLAFIKSNKSFMYKDIAESLNWYVSRLGKKEIASSTIKNYLKPYIDFGAINKTVDPINCHNNVVFIVNNDLLIKFINNKNNLI